MRRSTIWGAVFALIVVVLTAGGASAHAEGDGGAVGQCLVEEKVWVSVVTEEGEYLANECIEPTGNGEDALAATGVEIQHDDGGFICSIGGHPEPCPATFNGQYWHYYHGAEGQDWEMSMTGAAEHQIEPGTIEAWCYNAEGEEQCTPPAQEAMSEHAAQSRPEVKPAGEESNEESGVSPWAIGGGVVAAIALVAVIVFVLRSRGRSDDGAVGGR
ncbi:hypothetical protein FB460_1049 [Propioniferax innocua]|uniref:DUF4430 domain-containing protein n=2 Tax=Propioniferax innocua TaxID=1753 RepID=A0A542ZSE5_9ACTN|nr:hypothetical protein FB460_1049 [Propioniferax innocua]